MRARSGCRHVSPAEYAAPFFVNAATDASYRLPRPLAKRVIEPARASLSSKPSAASATEGSTSSDHAALP